LLYIKIGGKEDMEDARLVSMFSIDGLECLALMNKKTNDDVEEELDEQRVCQGGTAVT
jgi:hypothetical protein